MGCVHEEVCKFYDNGGCKNECEKTVPAKPKLTYANEVETLQALVERARGIGEDKYHGGPAECAACIYNRETVNDCHYDGGFIGLTDTKKRSACLVKDICIRQYEKDANLTGNQIADECQELLNTLVLCPGHNCGFVTKEREANRTYGGNYRCEKCSTIYDSSLWIAHWKSIEPVKRFEPFGLVVHVPDEGRLFQLMARLTFADKTIAHVNDAVSGRKLERKHIYYDEGNECYDRLYDKAKAMGIIE